MDMKWKLQRSSQLDTQTQLEELKRKPEKIQARGPFLEGPEKPFVKLPTACFGKPLF